MTAVPVDRVVPIVYVLQLVLPMTTIRVPRSPVTLDAAGLQLRVLIPAEPTTSAMPMPLLFKAPVMAFYRPMEVIILTALPPLDDDWLSLYVVIDVSTFIEVSVVTVTSITWHTTDFFQCDTILLQSNRELPLTECAVTRHYT